MNSYTDNHEAEALRKLMTDMVGYELPQEFSAFILRQAQKVCHEQDFASIQELINSLTLADTNGKLWRRFIAAMTIGESYLFRNHNHIHLLRKELLPRLIKKAQHEDVHIWSAGCARGEEPYTIAILLYELSPEAASLPIHILATDIDAEALEVGQKGLYGSWAFRQTPYHIRKKYFSLTGNRFALHPRIVSMVNFGFHHVATGVELPSFPRKGFDLILCRNVLMYLRQDYREKAARNLARNLNDDGFVIPGQVERLHGVDGILERNFHAGTSLYYRASSEPELIRRVATKASAASRQVSDFKRPAPPTQVERRSVPMRRPQTPAPSSPARNVDLSKTFEELLKQISSGEIDEADRRCNQHLEDYPLSPELHTILAMVYLERKQPEIAVRSLRRAIYCNPEYTTAYYLWWLVGLQYPDAPWARRDWVRRSLLRLTQGYPEKSLVVEREIGHVTAADIRYLVERNWASLER